MTGTTARRSETPKIDRNAMAAQICGVIAFAAAAAGGALRLTDKAGLGAAPSVIIAAAAVLIAVPALLLVMRKF